jgi:hypothetical protein
MWLMPKDDQLKTPNLVLACHIYNFWNQYNQATAQQPKSSFESAMNSNPVLMHYDTSNKPLEWTGHPNLSASPPLAPCLPLRAIALRIWGRRQYSTSAEMKLVSIGYQAKQHC